MLNQSVLNQKQQELVESIAKGLNDIILNALKIKGYPTDVDYIKNHLTCNTPTPNKSWVFHDGELLLEILTTWDYSNSSLVQVEQTYTLY